MSVVEAASVTLKKLLSTKSASAFVASYRAACRTGSLLEIMHPFKLDAKKKVSISVTARNIYCFCNVALIFSCHGLVVYEM